MRCIALLVVVPNALVFPAVFISLAARSCEQPGATWAGQMGLLILGALFVCAMETVFVLYLLYLWFGRQTLRVTGAGISCEKSLFGIVWSSNFYSAASIESWLWARNASMHVNNKTVVTRETISYECRLELREKPGKPVVLVSSSQPGPVVELCASLQKYFPERMKGELYSQQDEDVWWAAQPPVVITKKMVARRVRTACVVLLVGIFFLITGSYLAFRNYKMACEGVLTEATIVRVERERVQSAKRGGGSVYKLTLHFVDSIGRSHRAVPSTRTGTRRRVGEKMAIYYDPQQPDRVMRADAAGMYVLPGVFLFLGVAGTTAGLVLRKRARKAPAMQGKPRDGNNF